MQKTRVATIKLHSCRVCISSKGSFPETFCLHGQPIQVEIFQTTKQTAVIRQLLHLQVMSICYGLIVRKFRNTAMEQSGISRKMSQKNSADGDRRRVTIMCIALVAVFTVCWFLYHMVEIVRQYSHFSEMVRASYVELPSFDANHVISSTASKWCAVPVLCQKTARIGGLIVCLFYSLDYRAI